MRKGFIKAVCVVCSAMLFCVGIAALGGCGKEIDWTKDRDNIFVRFSDETATPQLIRGKIAEMLALPYPEMTYREQGRNLMPRMELFYKDETTPRGNVIIEEITVYSPLDNAWRETPVISRKGEYQVDFVFYKQVDQRIQGGRIIIHVI